MKLEKLRILLAELDGRLDVLVDGLELEIIQSNPERGLVNLLSSDQAMLNVFGPPLVAEMEAQKRNRRGKE